MQTVAIHLLILLHWTAYAAIFTLVGHSVLRRGLRLRFAGLFDSAWTGVLVGVGMLQIWHMFLPITCLPFFLMGGIAAMEAWLGRRELAEMAGRVGNTVLLLAMPAALWLAQQSLDPSFSYDSEVYHFATIRWCIELPLVPGLANLSIYYGLNQAYFLFAALIDRASLFPEGCLLTNGFLILLLTAECLHAGRQIYRTGLKSAPVSILMLCLALPFVLKLGQNNLSSPTPDVLVDLVIIRYFARLLAILETRPAGDPADTGIWMIFAAAAVPLKASLAGFAAAGILILTVGLSREQRSLHGLRYSLRIAVPAGLFFVLPYLIRGGIASGYPLFPLTSPALPVDWRVPEAEVAQLTRYIRGFARTHAHGDTALAAADGTAWITGWAAEIIRTFPGAMLLASLAVGLPIACWKPNATMWHESWRPALVLTLAGAFWFFSAPDIRFGGYLLHTAALWIWACAMKRVQDHPLLSPPGFRLLPLAVGSVTLLLVGRHWAGHANYPRAPAFPLRPLALSPTLTINIPDAPSEAEEWRIGYATPPATARVPAGLALRSRSLTGGFRRTGLPSPEKPRK